MISNSSPSRFVHVVAYQQTAQQTNRQPMRDWKYSSFFSFDIPIGSVRQTIHGTQFDEFTSWTSANDVKSLVF